MNVIDIVGTLQGILDQNAEVALKIQAVISEVMRSEVSPPKKEEYPPITKKWVDDLTLYLEDKEMTVNGTSFLLPRSLSDQISEEVKAYAIERGLKIFIDDRAVENDVKSGGNYSLSFTQTKYTTPG